MLRMRPVADARKAESYYAKSDRGYYLGDDDLYREWGGNDADHYYVRSSDRRRPVCIGPRPRFAPYGDRSQMSSYPD